MFVRLIGQGAEGDWNHGVWLDWLAWGGPIALVATVVVLCGKAIRVRHRYRAIDVLSASDLEAVHAALRAAEQRSVGEIVPMIVERSDTHPAAQWRAAVAMATAGSLLLAPWLPFDAPHWLFACQVGLGLAGFGLARALVDLRRSFVHESRATALAEEQAFQEFFRLKLHESAARSGVLLFVSLFERRVVVLADAGIDERVPDAAAWTATRDAVLAGIARGSLRDGLLAGIGHLGDVLADHFPATSGRNEIPDRVIVQSD